MKDIVKSARTGSSGSPFLSNTNTTNSRNSSAGNSVSSSSNASTNLLGHHNLLAPSHMVPSSSAPLLSDPHEDISEQQKRQQAANLNNLSADWKYQPHIARYYTG